ncbi:MAG: DUF2147 domain-containing protein [Rhizobiaceae bacterium]
MKNTAFGLVIAGISALYAGQAFAAGADGGWTRPDGTKVTVSGGAGKLYGKLTSGPKAGMEMFNGMAPAGANKWQGGAMKHPDMPGFMKFNGTVTLNGNSLSVKGCAVGQSMCDSETWKRAN